ncbi:Gluconate 5-dehydrogenase [Rhodovastum atsumiense]|uniref:Glucose 1-dehydrogenase n=1 Tax=Rhodovastum atsumiense TaxID=504468 RepID=A0A5M6ISD7_9PROT|nr:glucose 1-dehydrogenase [Rhodovastum atsumiense]KAA5611142.1 glucose 1-dehydrogenase [Rhodovastum atsumiense]CAH2599215.1 Gluconate 5-dehydrogenase [Rhodovastum atsumiense]
MNLFDLTGKVAIVTGGNGGIGLGMARGLAEAGARVVLAGRDAGKGGQAARDLGGEAGFIGADVTRKADCEHLVAETVRRCGRLDILVNNAGTAIRKSPQDYTEAEWHQVMDTNLTSAFLMCQAAYPALLQAGSGKVINIGSVMSLFAAPHTAPYAASKGGLVQFTKAIATAWAKDGIQCNAVLPGWIDTELTQGARRQVEGLNDAVLARTPAGRWGEPADLAGIAVFLAARASDFVTGAAIPCDGGYCARG